MATTLSVNDVSADPLEVTLGGLDNASNLYRTITTRHNASLLASTCSPPRTTTTARRDLSRTHQLKGM
jgi:hypothetical protein